MYFFHGRNTENNLTCISSMAEIQKTTECVFLPWQKDIKQPFLYFFHGRNTKNNRMCISSMEEIQKIPLSRQNNCLKGRRRCRDDCGEEIFSHRDCFFGLSRVKSLADDFLIRNEMFFIVPRLG